MELVRLYMTTLGEDRTPERRIYNKLQLPAVSTRCLTVNPEQQEFTSGAVFILAPDFD